MIAATSESSAMASDCGARRSTKSAMVAQSTCPLERMDTAGWLPLAIMSDSMRAPSLASAFAVSGCTGATTLAAEFSTRKRSCGSGCGSATAVLTTFNTNALRACCFCVAVLGSAFFGTAFGAGVFPCAAHKLAAKRTTIERWVCFFISYTVGCNSRVIKTKPERAPFHISLRLGWGEGLPIFERYLVEIHGVIGSCLVHVHLKRDVDLFG